MYNLIKNALLSYLAISYHTAKHYRIATKSGYS